MNAAAIKPCTGRCGRRVRPKTMRASEAPGTVRAFSGGRCRTCHWAARGFLPPSAERTKDQGLTPEEMADALATAKGWLFPITAEEHAGAAGVA